MTNHPMQYYTCNLRSQCTCPPVITSVPSIASVPSCAERCTSLLQTVFSSAESGSVRGTFMISPIVATDSDPHGVADGWLQVDHAPGGPSD